MMPARTLVVLIGGLAANLGFARPAVASPVVDLVEIDSAVPVYTCVLASFACDALESTSMTLDGDVVWDSIKPLETGDAVAPN